MYFWLHKIIRRLTGLDNRTLLIATFLLLGLSSCLIYLLEPDNFGNLFHALWWVMTTVTTVGYGDFYPKTVPGKLLGMVLFIFGIGLISLFISKAVDAVFIFKRNKEEGKLTYSGKGHFVIIEWSKNAELAVREILSTDPAANIVLIDEMERTPVTHEQIHYVRGNPVLKPTLDQANLGEARAAFIFAKDITDYGVQLRDDSFIDGKTLLIASAIERHYGRIRTVVEIRNRENVDSFSHVKVDEFILGGETVSRLAVRSAFHPGSSLIISQLLTSRDGNDLFEVPRRADWRTYRDAFNALLSEGATLISDGDDLQINRRLDEPIPDRSRLFVICDLDTYERICGT